MLQCCCSALQVYFQYNCSTLAVHPPDKCGLAPVHFRYLLGELRLQTVLVRCALTSLRSCTSEKFHNHSNADNFILTDWPLVYAHSEL